jgi:hypothetical protein
MSMDTIGVRGGWMSSGLALLSRTPISAEEFVEIFNPYGASVDPEKWHGFDYSRDGETVSIHLANYVIDEIAEHEEEWQHIAALLGSPPQSAINIWMSRPMGYVLVQEFVSLAAQTWNLCILDNCGRGYAIDAVSRLTSSGEIPPTQ